MSDETRNGPWRITHRQTVYDNPWISVTDHRVIHPGGTPGQYGVVGFKNRAIGVLALTEEGRVPMVGQHRFPLDRYSWELPEGGGPLAEDPLRAAQRELAEETGYEAAHWAPLIELDVSNSVTDETGIGYLAWDLMPGTAAPEASEALARADMPFGDVLAGCLDGRFRDSLTLVITLAAYAQFRRGVLPEAAACRIAAGLAAAGSS